MPLTGTTALPLILLCMYTFIHTHTHTHRILVTLYHAPYPAKRETIHPPFPDFVAFQDFPLSFKLTLHELYKSWAGGSNC